MKETKDHTTKIYFGHPNRRSGFRTTIVKTKDLNRHIKKNGITKSNRKITDSTGS